jgi:hypothetical protein
MFGRNVSALGQVNEADERNYEEKISQYQNHAMKPQLDVLYPVLCMSLFGEVPDDLDYVFPSIRVLTEKEKAELADIGSTAIIKPYTAGVISQRTTVMELKALGDKTEMYTNISEDDVEQANPDIGIPLEIETMAARGGNVVDPDTGEWMQLQVPEQSKPAKGGGN